MPQSSRIPGPATLVITAAIGVVVFWQSVGFHLLAPTSLGWLFAGGVDPSGHFLGWHMFRHEPWQWPPGAITSFGHPVGTSIALTDSIPLVALPLKVLGGFLPPVFQYMGLWLLTCFVLQAVFGALLMATATPRPLLQVLGSTLFALSPVLLHRIGHQALCAHWMLLAAIWLYVRTPALTGRRPLALWLLLVGMVAATHPYLTIQVAVIAAAAVLASLGGLGRPHLARAAATMVAGAAVIGAVWWVSGYFVVGSAKDLQDGGLGRLSLNLAAPLIPPPGALLDGRVPLAPLAHEQLEGYSYFGLGALLVLGIALPTCRPFAGSQGSSRQWALAAACGALTILAVSPTVTFDRQIVFQYDPSWWGPLSVFRSSGRLFWVVYYAILFAGIATLVKRLTDVQSAAILGLAVVLQAADMSGPQRLSRSAREWRNDPPLTSELWDIFPRHYRHLVLYPTNMCSREPGQDYRPLAVLAGNAGATINAGYAGRFDAKRLEAYCRALEQDIQEGRVSDDSLYVVPAAAIPRIQAIPTAMACAPADAYAVCFTVSSYAAWQSRVDLVRRSVPPLDELWRFRERLETDYRDRMRRPADDFAGSIAERLEAMAWFLAYRSGGCGFDEALSRASGSARARSPMCHPPNFFDQALPSSAETSLAWERLEQQWRQSGKPLEPTHVDAAGEALWLHAYVESRRRGHAEALATAEVLERIRAIAP